MTPLTLKTLQERTGTVCVSEGCKDFECLHKFAQACEEFGKTGEMPPWTGEAAELPPGGWTIDHLLAQGYLYAGQKACPVCSHPFFLWEKGQKNPALLMYREGLIFFAHKCNGATHDHNRD